jgi:hypothetical protein
MACYSYPIVYNNRQQPLEETPLVSTRSRIDCLSSFRPPLGQTSYSQLFASTHRNSFNKMLLHKNEQ